MMTWLRWFAVIPAGVLGWFIAFAAGVALLGAVAKVCPADSMVSGQCVAPWFDSVERIVICLSVAFSACLVVLLPVRVAPHSRPVVAWTAFAAGLIAATYLLVHTAAITEFFCAAVGGLLTAVAVGRSERKSAN
jgi:hypothetical protein